VSTVRDVSDREVVFIDVARSESTREVELAGDEHAHVRRLIWSVHTGTICDTHIVAGVDFYTTT
tara:strand:+ start:362 stop:553 length:192 start_codon:yes stop_codon:yes gene_type:complete